MRSFLLVVFILCILAITGTLVLIIYESIKKQYRYKRKDLFKIILGITMLCLVTIVVDFSLDNSEKYIQTAQNSSQENQINKVNSKEANYIEILELEKDYKDFNDNEKETFFDLIKNWNLQSEDFKSKYQNRKELLENEKDEYLKKEYDLSKEKYSTLINSIETDFTDMKVNYISENTETGKEKTLDINMKLLNNGDLTKKKCVELTVEKETEMKNEGITNINIYIKNNNEHAGLIFFELRDGKYHPDVSQIK